MEVIDRAKTRFEYLWRDETEKKSKEPGGNRFSRLRGVVATDWN
jgi:hypothetical protein